MTVLNNIYTSIKNKNAAELKTALTQASEQNININVNFPEREREKLSDHSELNFDFTQNAVTTTILKEFNALHFAISQAWLEGIVMLKIAGADLDCLATVILQTPTDDIEVNLNIFELMQKMSTSTLRNNMTSWLKASNDPRDWFQDSWIEHLIDESTHRALFQNDVFEKQAEEALAKYKPLFEKHQWFEAPFLVRYWLQVENIPSLNKIKKDWKNAHATLRKFLLDECVIPHISEQVSLENRLTLFREWQKYVRFLYTPASAHGSIQHTSFASFWYSPFNENCPEWLKTKWKDVMRGEWLQAHTELTAEFFNSRFEIQSQILIRQYPRLNKLDKLSNAIAAQNRQSDPQFQSAILAQVSREYKLIPFSQFGQTLLPMHSEVQQRDFTIQLLEVFRTEFDLYKLTIDDILKKVDSLSDKAILILNQLQEGHRLLADRCSINVDTLFMRDSLMAELAKVIDTNSPKVSNSKKSRNTKSKQKLNDYLKNANRNIRNWLEVNINSALTSKLAKHFYPCDCSSNDLPNLAPVIDSLRKLEISGKLSPRGTSTLATKESKRKASRKMTPRSGAIPTTSIGIPELTLPNTNHDGGGSPPLLFTLARGASLDPESQAIKNQSPSLSVPSIQPSAKSPRNKE